MPLEIEQLDLERYGGIDAAIVAYPHAAAAPTVGGAARARRARGRPERRLPAALAARPTSAGTARTRARSCSSEAAYGLTELHREAIAGADIVANPGCYPTASLLGARAARPRRPDRRRGDRRQAGHLGRRALLRRQTHLSMAGENILPYKVADHRHTPEIEEQLALARRAPIADDWVQFQAHLVPLDQGELASCYVTPTRAVDERSCASCTRDAYADEPFVEVAEAPPGTREVRDDELLPPVRGRRRAHGKVLVLSAIDNLWKGTSSQAVQNLNVMFGLPETRDGRLA